MSKRLIVGLGNPGPEYETTRHNVGFMVIDQIAERCRAPVTSRRDQALSGWGKWRGREVGLAKPQTYMNRSGHAMTALVKRYGLEPKDVLVLVDDIHIPLGTLRIRPKGGAGGHNGVQDIIDWWDRDDFPRLRMGVGGEFERGEQSSYVLSPFDASEIEQVNDMLDRAGKAALTWITDGLQTAMNRFNG